MKKQFFSHIGSVLLILLFCFLAIGSGTKEKATTHSGFINQAQQIEKDFISVGIIFVKSQAIIDQYGNVLSGSKITYEMLMKEVEKLGGDDIINLRIDEERNSKTKEVSYTATALAIKYIEKN